MSELDDVMKREYTFITPVERHSLQPLVLVAIVMLASLIVGWLARGMITPTQPVAVVEKSIAIVDTPTPLASPIPAATATATPTVTPTIDLSYAIPAGLASMYGPLPTATPTMIAGYLPCDKEAFGVPCYPMATATPTNTPTPSATATPMQICRASDYAPNPERPCKNNQGVNPWK